MVVWAQEQFYPAVQWAPCQSSKHVYSVPHFKEPLASSFLSMVSSLSTSTRFGTSVPLWVVFSWCFSKSFLESFLILIFHWAGWEPTILENWICCQSGVFALFRHVWEELKQYQRIAAIVGNPAKCSVPEIRALEKRQQDKTGALAEKANSHPAAKPSFNSSSIA